MTKATLADWLDDLAARYGKREALVDGTRRWTYAELATATERIARGLVTVGVGKETRIGILLPNRAEWLVTAFAGFRLGALVVALNTFSPAPELRRSLVHADVQLLVVQPRFLGHDYLARLGEMSPARSRRSPPARRSCCRPGPTRTLPSISSSTSARRS